MTIEFPEGYPIKPPIFRVQNPKEFYHPNIDKDSGYICSRTLNKVDTSQKLRDRIEAFLQLLANPNPGDPLNDVAAKQFEEDDRKYYREARLIYLKRKVQENERKGIFNLAKNENNEKKEEIKMVEQFVKVSIQPKKA